MKILKTLVVSLVLAGAAMSAGVSVAQAAQAVATSGVNVRSGPGTGYSVVSTLQAGTVVEVIKCQGSWCLVEKPGPDGWVSKNYLAAKAGGGASINTSGAGFSMSFGDGNGGVTIGFGSGSGFGGWGHAPQHQNRVCFYDKPGLQGASHCVNVGAATYNLQGAMRKRIASIQNPPGAMTYACTDVGLQGNCQVYSGRADFVGAQMAGRIVSFKTYYPEY